MHNVNNPEFKQKFSFDDTRSMNEFAASLNRNPMIKSVNQIDKFGVEVVARDPQTLNKLNEMYDTTPVDPKKKMKDVEEPLKGKGYPHNEDDEKNFKPHMMYDPKTGKGYKADTYQDHLDMKKKGYGHDKPDDKKKVEEEVGLDEAKTVTLVAKKGSKTLETVKKVSPKERKTVEMLMKSAHGKDVKIEVVKEDIEQVDELDTKTTKSYIDKAQRDNTKRVTRMSDKPSHMKADKGEMKKLRKRQKGVVKAKKRMGEETEQVIEGDGVMIRELGLYIANNGDMYRQRIQPIIKNMRRKLAKGIYDEKLAAKGFMHAVTDGIKRYNKEYGAGSMKLSKSEKEEVALILLRDYQDEIREGINYDLKASALLMKRIFSND